MHRKPNLSQSILTRLSGAMSFDFLKVATTAEVDQLSLSKIKPMFDFSMFCPIANSSNQKVIQNRLPTNKIMYLMLYTV